MPGSHEAPKKSDKVPTLEEAYEFEMDQRMIDAMDPTSYGGYIIKAVNDDDDEDDDDTAPGADEDDKAIKDKKPKNHFGVTSVFTEDRDWGN